MSKSTEELASIEDLAVSLETGADLGGSFPYPETLRIVATRLRELEAENQRLRESRRELAERAFDYGIAAGQGFQHESKQELIDALLTEEPSDGE